MISLVSAENKNGFLSACLFDDIAGARMRTLLECYGLDMSILLLWLQTDEKNNPTAAISLFSGYLTVSAGLHADMEELAGFARTVGGFRRVEAAEHVCDALKTGGEYTGLYAMRYNSGKFTGDFGGIIESPPPREIYNVLCGSDPAFAGSTDFAGWYAHTSHLFRHNLGFACALAENGRLISTGGVYTSGERVAVIGCVATLPDFRGRGYAATITKYLVNRILDAGKIPALLCATDKLAGYYGQIGFTNSGRYHG